MRRTLFALLLAAGLAGWTGCAQHRMAATGDGDLIGRGPAGHVGHLQRGPRAGGGGGMAEGMAGEGFAPGPPVAQVGYPYYTLHGPRDFLARNPASLGP